MLTVSMTVTKERRYETSKRRMTIHAQSERRTVVAVPEVTALGYGCVAVPPGIYPYVERPSPDLGNQGVWSLGLAIRSILDRLCIFCLNACDIFEGNGSA